MTHTLSATSNAALFEAMKDYFAEGNSALVLYNGETSSSSGYSSNYARVTTCVLTVTYMTPRSGTAMGAYGSNARSGTATAAHGYRSCHITAMAAHGFASDRHTTNCHLPAGRWLFDTYQRRFSHEGLFHRLVWAKVQGAITVIGGWLGYFLGGLDGLMIALVVFVILDYVTGIMCAITDKKLSSAVGFKGICRKVLIFLLVGVAHIVDLHVVGSGSALRGAVVCFYLSNEGVSMLENAAHLGLPIPEKLKVILEQLHDRESPATPDDTTDNTNDGQ